MPFDLQVIHPRAQVPLDALQVVPGLLPRTLEITGGPFTDVEEVTINGVPSPSAIIASSTQILAQVPSGVGSISQVEVLSSSFFLSPRATYAFRLGRQAKLLSGLPKLVQSFVRMLLQTPGSSILMGDAGGGLLDMMRSSQSAGDARALVSGAHLCVQKASGDLVSYQTRDARLPRNERLAFATLTGCTPTGTRLVMDIALGNQAGEGGRSLLNLLRWGACSSPRSFEASTADSRAPCTGGPSATSRPHAAKCSTSWWGSPPPRREGALTRRTATIEPPSLSGWFRSPPSPGSARCSPASWSKPLRAPPTYSGPGRSVTA